MNTIHFIITFCSMAFVSAAGSHEKLNYSLMATLGKSNMNKLNPTHRIINTSNNGSCAYLEPREPTNTSLTKIIGGTNDEYYCDQDSCNFCQIYCE